LKKNLTTPAGPTEARDDKDAYVNAINQVFALYRRNYHLQYFKAWPNEEELSVTKRLWLDSLRRFPAHTILKAAKSVIESSEFLPTLRTMLQHCEQCSDAGLPDAHRAYIEACRAPSPKANAPWSHPAVYYAGKNCDWYFLQSNTEEVAFPHFKREYDKLCQRVLHGTKLGSPATVSLPENIERSLDKKTNLHHLQSLKDKLKL